LPSPVGTAIKIICGSSPSDGKSAPVRRLHRSGRMLSLPVPVRTLFNLLTRSDFVLVVAWCWQRYGLVGPTLCLRYPASRAPPRDFERHAPLHMFSFAAAVLTVLTVLSLLVASAEECKWRVDSLPGRNG
jgi:hypothetical protein